VRADPASSVSLADHKLREAFVVEVMDLQAKVAKLTADLAARRGAATGDEIARIQTLEQRLGGGGGGGRRGGGAGPAAGGAAPVQPVSSRLGPLLSPFTMSGARTGTLSAPTGAMRAALADVKADLAAIEKEMKKK
jgi:hypothetical protein